MTLEHAGRSVKGVTTLQYVGDDGLATRNDGGGKGALIAIALAGGALAMTAKGQGTRQMGAAAALLAGLIALTR